MSRTDKVELIAKEPLATLFGHVLAAKEVLAKIPNEVAPFSPVPGTNQGEIKTG
jgi:hypothetical protein